MDARTRALAAQPADGRLVAQMCREAACVMDVLCGPHACRRSSNVTDVIRSDYGFYHSI